jgi:hypothetical protein
MNKPNFRIENYRVVNEPNNKQLIIDGYKLPPPSKRITICQKNIKVLSAKIVYKHKKGDQEMDVVRINHLKSFGEIRLHSSVTLYPGIYEVTLEYQGELNEDKLVEGTV